MRRPERYQVQRVGWEIFLVVLVGTLLAYTWMFGAISVPNERSRVYLAVAMVDGGTLSIDKELLRWGKIYDLAEYDTHYYSDKAPGSSMLGAVVYFVASRFKPAPEWTIRELINLFRTWLMIPLSLIGFLLLRRILEYVGLDPPVIDIASLAWILGSAAFHYGAAYFGHQIVAVALIASLYCLLRASEYGGQSASATRWMVVAGAAAGVAGLTEYQAAIPCIFLLVYAFFGESYERTRRMTAFVAGAAPFALILLAYNNAAFGGPFALSYQHLANAHLQKVHGVGIAGVTVPHWKYFAGSMFSLHRGLFGTSPLFLAVIPGVWFAWRAGFKLIAGLTGATFVYFVLFVSSSNMWFAGWGFGPRLLVPALGLLTIPVAFAVQEAMNFPITEGIVKGLAIAQICYFQIVVAFFPEPPESATNPLRDYVAKMISEGITSPNLGQKVFHLQGLGSLKPLLVLVAIAVLIVALRGTKPLKRSSRAIVVVGIVAMLFAAASIVRSRKAAWSPTHQTKWVRTLKGWESREKLPI